MCASGKIVPIYALGRLINSCGNSFFKMKVDYIELTDEEQWEEIAKSFKY